MASHNDIVKLFEEYTVESDKFESKGVKAAATRARKALSEIAKLSKVRRAEIQEIKNNM
tara:strand:+ start:791 stop:967 length:177 start_codon:yes stop_codon:yes gene_type:complete